MALGFAPYLVIQSVALRWPRFLVLPAAVRQTNLTQCFVLPLRHSLVGRASITTGGPVSDIPFWHWSWWPISCRHVVLDVLSERTVRMQSHPVERWLEGALQIAMFIAVLALFALLMIR